MDLCDTAVLLLHIATEEARMSINAVHGTAACLRFQLNVQEYVRAATRDGERLPAAPTHKNGGSPRTAVFVSTVSQ